MKKKKNLHLLSSMLNPLSITMSDGKYRGVMKIYKHLALEFGDVDIHELLIAVVRKYHTNFQPKGKAGRKIKWSPLICATLAVHIDHLKKQTKQPWVKLGIDPIWSKCQDKNTKDPKDTFLPQYEKGKLPIHEDLYKLAENYYGKTSWNSFLKAVLKEFLKP